MGTDRESFLNTHLYQFFFAHLCADEKLEWSQQQRTIIVKQVFLKPDFGQRVSTSQGYCTAGNASKDLLAEHKSTKGTHFSDWSQASATFHRSLENSVIPFWSTAVISEQKDLHQPTSVEKEPEKSVSSSPSLISTTASTGNI